jgi:F5/8 type C domain
METSGHKSSILNGFLLNVRAFRLIRYNIFIQKIDFLEARELTGIATQGDVGSNSWVRAFRIEYSDDRVNWNSILNINKQPKVRLTIDC